MAVLIRPWNIDDLPQLVAQANDVQIWNNMRDAFPHPYTAEAGESFIQANSEAATPLNFAVEADGYVTGGIGIILNRDVYVKSAEIGYWIGSAYWGRGIGTEAVRQMAEYTFYYFDIIRLYAEVFETNKASMRVLEKNGFYLEGVRRKAVFKNNQLMDDYIWVKIRPW